MSGTIATLSAAASVGSALETLSFGAAGPVVLGEFCFQSFEVPGTICLPVKQGVALHKLIGGARVPAAMGPDYGDITWGGCMLGAFAEERAQMLKALVDSGQMAVLSWGIWAFTVLPHALSLREQYQRVGYAIQCTVIRDESSAPVDGPVDLNTSVAQDLTAAIASGGSAVPGTLGSLQAVIQKLAPILPGSSGVDMALSALAGAQGVANTASAVAARDISATGKRAAPLGLPVASMGDLGLAASTTEALAQAGQASSYLGRAAANLTANL